MACELLNFLVVTWREQIVLIMNKYKLFSAIFLLTASGIAHGNLIVNGGFESPDINSGWTFGTDPSGGWKGDNIEVWASGFNGVASYEGNQHGELNAHPYDGTPWTIYQSFETILNELYDISFAYRARSSDSEAFQFSLVDSSSIVFDKTIDDHVTGKWDHFSGSFWGTGNQMTLTFTSINPGAGTVGNFLDAVKVASVPEPAIISLFGVGLVGLGFVRRRARK
jgi:hypothetical protein